MVEPLSVGVHIVKQGGVKPGDSVVVYGAGPVGLVCMVGEVSVRVPRPGICLFFVQS